MLCAIIFDFDGTIVDSEPMHEAALRAAARDLSMDFSEVDYRTKYLGFDDRDIYAAVAAAHNRRLLPADIARLNELKWTHAREAIESGRVPEFEGAVRLMKEAAAAAPIAVCSGARRHELELILGRLGVRDLLQTLVTADDVPKSKPDPAPYMLTTSRLGIPANHCVAIEDTDKGVKSARVAGLWVVGVCHSMTAGELAGAHQVVDSISQLTLETLRGLACCDSVH
jgi:HAD superfamily hydrolase (TIGR01509 family)